jgi:hypothetical protein
MDQGQRTVFVSMRSQKRQGDKMVPAKGQHALAGVQDGSGMRLKPGYHLLACGGVETEVTAVNDVQSIKHAKLPGPTAEFPVQMGCGHADGRWTRARPRPDGGCQVKGHPGDDDIRIITDWIL